MPNRKSLAAWQGGADPDEPRPDGTVPDAPPAIINAPVKARVIVPCPDCRESVVIDARLFARRVKDSDGSTSISLRTRAPKVTHDCGQLTLDAQATGDLSR